MYNINHFVTDTAEGFELTVSDSDELFYLLANLEELQAVDLLEELSSKDPLFSIYFEGLTLIIEIQVNDFVLRIKAPLTEVIH